MIAEEGGGGLRGLFSYHPDSKYFYKSLNLTLEMVHKPPNITLSPLDRADGSASYSNNGYTIIGGINGPVEVQRRDELPEEAAIEVNIRPASGVAGW